MILMCDDILQRILKHRSQFVDDIFLYIIFFVVILLVDRFAYFNYNKIASHVTALYDYSADAALNFSLNLSNSNLHCTRGVCALRVASIHFYSQALANTAPKKRRRSEEPLAILHQISGERWITFYPLFLLSPRKGKLHHTFNTFSILNTCEV